MTPESVLGIYAEKVALIPGQDCWFWTGLKWHGYGYVGPRVRGQPDTATMIYRIAFESAYWRIGKGLAVDHLCRNKACCNPRHLEAVPRDVNWRRNYLKPEQHMALAASRCRRARLRRHNPNEVYDLRMLRHARVLASSVAYGLNDGCSVGDACRYAGIDARRHAVWMARGLSGTSAEAYRVYRSIITGQPVVPAVAAQPVNTRRPPPAPPKPARATRSVRLVEAVVFDMLREGWHDVKSLAAEARSTCKRVAAILKDVPGLNMGSKMVGWKTVRVWSTSNTPPPMRAMPMSRSNTRGATP